MSLSSAHRQNFWHVYKSNPVVGCMLAGVISHQPAQALIIDCIVLSYTIYALMINLTGLTVWVIISACHQWSVLTISYQHAWQC